MKKITTNKWIILAVFIVIFMVLLSYVLNFHGHKISKDTTDWGNFGSFLAGAIGSVLSSATLFFVAKTYLIQKDELDEARISAKLADELRQKSTEAQILLTKNYIEQTKNSNKLVQIQLLATKINSNTQQISSYIMEVERVTLAISGNKDFHGIDGKKYNTNREAIYYRSGFLEKIKIKLAEIKEIEDLIAAIEVTLTDSSGEVQAEIAKPEIGNEP